MGIDKVRKNIISGTEEKLQEVGEKMKTGDEIDRLFNMGEGFLARKNYSISYFMYFRCLRNIALLYIMERIGDRGGFSSEEALRVVVEKKFLDISEKKFEEFSKKYHQVINRKYLEKSDAEEIRDVILRLRGGYRPKTRPRK